MSNQDPNYLDRPYQNDPRWLLAQRVAASPGFAHSHRLSTFLLYVCRQSLRGESASLSERNIGETVFQRSTGYDTRDDNIVRSHASRLRNRLQAYFQTDGAQEPLRMYIPPGSYAPVFQLVDAALSGESAEPGPAQRPSSSNFITASPISTLLHKHPATALRLVGVLALAVAFAAAFAYRRSHPAPPQTPSHKLWSQMFQRNRETLIVPADSSLGIARMMSGHGITLAEYAGGAYRESIVCEIPCDVPTLKKIEGLRYTSVADLEFAVRVTHLPEAVLDRTEIRYARDLQLKDFKESNLILTGGQVADPWVRAISGGMNFVLHADLADGPPRVENRQPRSGEKSEYLYDPLDGQHRGLAAIAFLPNLSGSGNLLVMQGFSSAGTQAAADFVTSGEVLDALFPAYSGNSRQLPHFEILLSTVEINGMASRPVPLAWRTYP